MDKWIDSNVEKVSNLLKERMNKGFIKYGTTTERTDIDFIGWIQHLQEELLDAAVYAERIKQEYNATTVLNLDGMDNSINFSDPNNLTITVVPPEVVTSTFEIQGEPYELTTSVTVTSSDR